MIITPKIRGFICTTAHPVGCAAHVQEQIDYIRRQPGLKHDKPHNVLVIGASTGYGLATRIATAFGAAASTIGVAFEKPADDKRTASAGWYNTAAFERAAHQAGLYAKSLNGDAFSDELKRQTVQLIRRDWPQGVDLVIYSLASPRRLDPRSGAQYSAVLKPIEENFKGKTVNIMSGEVSDVDIRPASSEEIQHTIKVMGGEDWKWWMHALLEAGVLAKGARAVAYSYLGPQLTFALYRHGTIGKAKEDLEATAHELDALLQKQIQGRAWVSINKGLVTQSSAAIPVVPLYISILYKVMKAKQLQEGCIEQMWRLLKMRLYCPDAVPVDAENRIRLDDWELHEDIQAEVARIWPQVNTGNLSERTDIEGYRHEFHRLFGFDMAGVDYAADVDPEVAIPSLSTL